MEKKWFEITFCTKWYEKCADKEYEIDNVFTKAETREQAKEWFLDFVKMFERDYPAEIVTYKINWGLPT